MPRFRKLEPSRGVSFEALMTLVASFACPCPGVAWMHTYPWIHMQYLIFGSIAHTHVCAIQGYPLYAYPQY